MLGKAKNQSAAPNDQKPTGKQRMKISHELVMAIADRVYARLLHELKIERERRRFLPGNPRRSGGR